MRVWGSVAGGRPAGSSSERPGTVACASEGQQAASCWSLGRAGATIRLAKTERRSWCRGWAEPRRAVCPRPVAASADPGLLPGDRPPPVLAEELVEGLSEQGLDRPALGGAEQAQLAVDGWGKVAGDLDAAGTAVPGGPAGSGGCGVFACPRVRCGCFCIRHSALPGSRADRLAARVLRRRRPRTASARGCLPAGLSERSCALPPPDCRVYPGFARLAMGVAGATCPRCHDCCGLRACRALATLLARGPVSDWDDLSATAARTVGSAARGRSAARPRPWPWTGPIPGRWGVCRACGRVR